MSWIALVILGSGLLWLQRITGNMGDAILVRCAAFVFLAAGTVGASGWMGSTMSALIGAARSALDGMGGAMFGTSLSWIAAVALAAVWIAAMLPDRFTRYRMRAWMVYAGLVLPSVLTAVPGSLGAGLRGLVMWAGTGTNLWITGLVA